MSGARGTSGARDAAGQLAAARAERQQNHVEGDRHFAGEQGGAVALRLVGTCTNQFPPFVQLLGGRCCGLPFPLDA